MHKPIYSRFASLLYNALVRTVRMSQIKYLSSIWQTLWDISCDFLSCPVRTRIHGYTVILNYGNTYPIYARRFTELNNPLIELVYQCYSFKKRPLTLIDVGASIGDTMLLLYRNCPGMINDFYCFDGDPEFYRYLKKNLEHLKEGKVLLSLLSSSEGYEKELVHVHRGTASAQGEHKVQSSTLDSVIREFNPQQIDVLKIDVDGFDGRVLRGSKNTIHRYHPAIIFEWHPILCRQTGNNWIDHFEALDELGYNKFIWFNKYGSFSHFMINVDKGSIDVIAALCLSNSAYHDLHYDIIALHRDNQISLVALAELAFARRRNSFY